MGLLDFANDAGEKRIGIGGAGTALREAAAAPGHAAPGPTRLMMQRAEQLSHISICATRRGSLRAVPADERWPADGRGPGDDDDEDDDETGGSGSGGNIDPDLDEGCDDDDDDDDDEEPLQVRRERSSRCAISWYHLVCTAICEVLTVARRTWLFPGNWIIGF